MNEPRGAPITTLRGNVASGLGKAAGFTELLWVQHELEQKLGFRPWPGTLNLRVTDPESQTRWSRLSKTPGIPIEPPTGDGCVAWCYPVELRGSIVGAIVAPHVEGYPVDQIEIIAADQLRPVLGADGSTVEVTVLPWSPTP